ncbi:SDR family oxidoreductase [Acidimicrobiaceae bacterium]|nr:SDR family oxidoreductase [Acidimicrobiaceae bacterium]|tara:strand:- start:885 stop:1697 length:813 start_codon:yes stop_codon:yes gene_type:complete
MDIKNAQVLVTGGSRGIGAALAHEYSAKGARVIVTARSGEDLERVATEINGVAHVADLSTAETVDNLIQEIESLYGPIDVLVNNAGVETVNPVATVATEDIRTAARINLETPMVLTRQVLPGMIERERGALVYLSSLAGTSGFAGMGPYCATKAGLNNFVAALRIELKNTPIHATLVAPGPVDTRMWDAVETASESIQRSVQRFENLGFLPKTTPEKLAKRVVLATQNKRRHVRHPHRLALNFWLGEAPRRITEASMIGVKFNPLDYVED